MVMQREEEVHLNTAEDVDRLEALINFHFWMAKGSGEVIVVEIWKGESHESFRDPSPVACEKTQ